jgi:hypothetical protein
MAVQALKLTVGVKRIEAISAQLSTRSRAFLFVGCFLVAYVYGLDGVRRFNSIRLLQSAHICQDTSIYLSRLRNRRVRSPLATGDYWGRTERDWMCRTADRC